MITIFSMKKGALLPLMSCFLLVNTVQASSLEGFATLNGGTTGGEGGEVVYASTGTEINQAMCGRESTDTPLTIYVNGTINHENTEKASGSCDTADDKIQFKRVKNISLIGVDDNALFDEIGIHLRDTSNIIIQNVHIRNVKKSGSPISNGGDAIGMESNVFNIWVDHNELEASGGEKDGYDSLIDMKATTQYVTVSYNYLHHSGRGGLIGSSDSDSTNTYITFHHNYYEKIDSRTPLLRHGTAHAYNNYYHQINKSGMNPRIGGQIKAENNHFQNAHNPIGTFYTNEMGYWALDGNIFEDVTWKEADKQKPAGPNPSSTTTISIPYQYQLDDAECVRSIVSQTAGSGTGLAVSDGQCGTTTQPDPTDPTDPSQPETPQDKNLSIDAGSDGSSKGMGSFGSVRDGDLATFWSPDGATGRISIKWPNDVTINTVIIREAQGFAGNIQSWQLEDHVSGQIIATGVGAGQITFAETQLTKINFVILTSNGTPTVAEFETYLQSIVGDDSENGDSAADETDGVTIIETDDGTESSVDSNTDATISVGAFSFLTLLLFPLLLSVRLSSNARRSNCLK